ncbi:MAG: hypothetical protein WD795_22020 [Woeseia sp.]
MAQRIQFDAQGNEVDIDLNGALVETKEQFEARTAGGAGYGASVRDVNAENLHAQRTFEQINDPAKAERNRERLAGTIEAYNDLVAMEEQLRASGRKLNQSQTERKGHLFRDISIQAAGVPGALDELGISVD